MRRRFALSLTGAVAVTLLAVTAAQSRTNAGTINIGWSGDKSGPTAASQLPVLHALEAYFRMVNATGGVNGEKINLIEKDDKYNVATELANVKSLINDDHVVLVTGIGNSSGFASILPVLNGSKVAGLSNQGTLKSNSWPFQPWIFEGDCNYGDQADVALAYEMAHTRLFSLKTVKTPLNKKYLKGLKVGIAGIDVSSGQEWIQDLNTAVTKLGGSPVDQTLPTAIVNADVQIQAFQNAGVKFILMHHAVPGGIAVLKSMSKFGFDVPVSGSFGVTQNIVWQSSPYDSAKDFVGVNCYTPPTYLGTAEAKLAVQTGKKYGYSATEIDQPNWALGWVNAQLIVAGLKNVKGAYTGTSVRQGLEQVRNLDTGDLSPQVTLTPKCHMAVRQVRPYAYSWKKKTMIPVGSYAQWAKFITNSYAAPGTCGKPRGKG